MFFNAQKFFRDVVTKLFFIAAILYVFVIVFISWQKNFFHAARKKILVRKKSIAARKKYFVTLTRKKCLALEIIPVGDRFVISLLLPTPKKQLIYYAYYYVNYVNITITYAVCFDFLGAFFVREVFVPVITINILM